MAPDGLASGGAGAGSGAAARPNPTTGSDAASFPRDRTRGRNVTPWQQAINIAMMCVVGAALALKMASSVAKGA